MNKPASTTKVRLREPGKIFSGPDLVAAAAAAKAKKIADKEAKLSAKKAAAKARKVEERIRAREELCKNAKRKRAEADVGDAAVAKRTKATAQCRDCGLVRKSGKRNWVKCDVCDCHWVCGKHIEFVNSLSACKE